MVSTADDRRMWNPRGGWVALLALLVVVALIAVVAYVLYDRFNGDDEELASVPDIVAAPDSYYGEDNLRVSGEVNRILGEFAYTLGGPEFGDVELLVVGPPPPVATEDRPEEAPLIRGDIVQIAGDLEPFEIEAVEDDIDADLDDEAMAEFSDQPVLIAQSSVLWPRFPVARGVPTSIESILDDPEGWGDDSFTVTGEVVNTLSDNLFILQGGEGNEIVVVDASGGVTPRAAEAADTVQVTGPVVEFDVETVEAESEVELDAEAAESVAGQPTIIGQIMYILPT